MEALLSGLSPGDGLKERLAHTADLAPLEHLLKLIDLLPHICQAVIQAGGDLDGGKASIVKMTL